MNNIIIIVVVVGVVENVENCRKPLKSTVTDFEFLILSGGIKT